MNAIELLKKDHQKVAGLFKQYESAGEDAATEKEELFRRIKRELDIHARIEEEIFYPAARQVPLEEARELVAEAHEEHKQVKTLLAELDGIDAEDEQFDAKMKVLKEDVEHHVEEEEDELFPKVKKGLGRDRLEDLGRQLEYRRQSIAAAGGFDDDEDDETGEERGAVRKPDSRTQGRESSPDSRGGSNMASRGSASSDTRDDVSAGSMGSSGSRAMEDGSRMGSMGAGSRTRSPRAGARSRRGATGRGTRSRTGSRGSRRGSAR
ncbi:MAG TPA: hemerythrin domain-containing protein [Candidatus Eisenbacteria bacterium]